MDDAEHKHDAIFLDHIEHHAVIAYAEAVKGLGYALERLHPFAADAIRFCQIDREPLEARSDAITGRRRELRVCPGRRRPELDAITLAQSSSERLTVRPLRYASRARRRIATYSSA